MLDLYHFSTVQNLLQQWNLSTENPSPFNTNLWINEIDNSQFQITPWNSLVKITDKVWNW